MYQLLPRSDPENTTASTDDLQAKTPPEPVLRTNRFPSWVLVACIVCTIANFASIYIFPPSAVPQSVAFLLESPQLTRHQISRLRRPSQFVGLNRIHQHLSTDVEPFVNKPFLTSRIDESNPGQSFFEADQRASTEPIGTISLQHHHFVMTSTMSTIFQFRALDYGMEACELTIALPAPHSAPRSEPVDYVGEPSFEVSDLPITLRLSQLDASFALDAETISFRTQPQTLRDINDFSIRELPATFTHNFTCRMEEVFTFRLGCQSPRCHMGWWQDSGMPVGVTVKQHVLLPEVA